MPCCDTPGMTRRNGGHTASSHAPWGRARRSAETHPEEKQRPATNSKTATAAASWDAQPSHAVWQRQHATQADTLRPPAPQNSHGNSVLGRAAFTRCLAAAARDPGGHAASSRAPWGRARRSAETHPEEKQRPATQAVLHNSFGSSVLGRAAFTRSLAAAAISHTCNPHGTAPPTPHAHQQCAWHSATHATRKPAIRMAQRHPRDTLTSHPHGTAPPTRRAHQQSAWHSATHATRTPAIRMAQRHPRHTHTSNAHGTAPPTRHAHQPHSATHATRSPAIRMAQRHPRDAHTSNPHGTAPPTRRAHQQSAWHSATQRPVKPAHQAAKSSTQRESSPQRPETARTGPQRPETARTTHPPYDRPPATKSNSAIRFFFCTRSSSYAPQQHPPAIRSVTPEASPRNLLGSYIYI